YDEGGNVLSARYTTSNAIHQASKLPKSEWQAFFAWLADYEYDHLALPKPDAVFLLDIPTETALEMINSRAERLGTSPDIHERDTAYLLHCAEASHAAAEFFGWTRIPVMADGKLLPMETITEKLYALMAL
ncbi:MAG: thymidylate kinase, partial [Clostridia bacterium]|nr:thymidylate kinase [Clostridia bacterium]